MTLCQVHSGTVPVRAVLGAILLISEFAEKWQPVTSVTGTVNWSSQLLVGSVFLWLPCIADADIIFLPCGFYLSFHLYFLA